MQTLREKAKTDGKKLIGAGIMSEPHALPKQIPDEYNNRLSKSMGFAHVLFQLPASRGPEGAIGRTEPPDCVAARCSMVLAPLVRNVLAPLGAKCSRAVRCEVFSRR